MEAISPIPTILGVCQSQKEKKPNNAKRRRETIPEGGKRFQRRLAEAMREEIAERIGQMGDLWRINGGGGGGDGMAMNSIIQHYLEAIQRDEEYGEEINGETRGGGGNDDHDEKEGDKPAELMEKVRKNII
jgi:hypothetical protein